MKTVLFSTLLTATLFAATSFAAGAPSKEERMKMAEMHTQMAECLKSDKPIGECHKEMMNSCEKAMGKDGCPMMGHMHGMGKKGMMQDKEEEKSEGK